MFCNLSGLSRGAKFSSLGPRAGAWAGASPANNAIWIIQEQKLLRKQGAEPEIIKNSPRRLGTARSQNRRWRSESVRRRKLLVRELEASGFIK